MLHCQKHTSAIVGFVTSESCKNTNEKQVHNHKQRRYQRGCCWRHLFLNRISKNKNFLRSKVKLFSFVLLDSSSALFSCSDLGLWGHLGIKIWNKKNIGYRIPIQCVRYDVSQHNYRHQYKCMHMHRHTHILR